MNYARAFRISRAAFGLTQSQLASRIGISASQLSLIEAGKRKPSLKTIDSMARAVGIPQALISLLASDQTELREQLDDDVAEISRLLLQLLVKASDDDPQGSLPLEGIG